MPFEFDFSVLTFNDITEYFKVLIEKTFNVELGKGSFTIFGIKIDYNV